jgi:hypothetical protein
VPRASHWILAGVVAIAGALAWRCRSAPPEVVPVAAARAPDALRRADMPAPAGGRIAGTVRAGAGAPIAEATVCATPTIDGLIGAAPPSCSATGADGRYALGGLADGSYVISASAAGRAPALWRAADGLAELRVRGAQARADIDLVLDGGAVLVRGAVRDLTGGPIAGALVTAHPPGQPAEPSGFVRSADDGGFALWARPGLLALTAEAEGYAADTAEAIAPGAEVELRLTPESVLAGVVVTAADRTPIAGALVEVDDALADPEAPPVSARTDAAGRFRIARLPPGRYQPRATIDGGRGEAAASVRLGLGETVDDVVIVVAPMARVRGRLVIVGAAGERPCPRGYVSIERPDGGAQAGREPDEDGLVAFPAIAPGRYQVFVFCKDQHEPAAPTALTVGDADITDARWVVPELRGAITGHVRGPTGAPIADASVEATSEGAELTATATTDRAGAFTIHGVTAGRAALAVTADDLPALRPAPTVAVVDGQVATVELVLATGGAITGAVVDEAGAPIADAVVRAYEPHPRAGPRTRTAADGTFTLRGLEPGDVRVVAARAGVALRAPGGGPDDEPGVHATTVDGATATIRIVVAGAHGAITGEVVDDAGRAIGDAFVIATQGADAPWASARRPVLTEVDGTFALTELAPGRYAVRALRRGGGVAQQDQVEVGARVRLTMAATGTLGGRVVRDDAPIGACAIAITGRRTGVERTERVAAPDGQFAIRDLPADTYDLDVTADSAHGGLQVALGAGEVRLDLRLALDATVPVRGRIVEAIGGRPVAGIQVAIGPARGGTSAGSPFVTSGADGRFEVPAAPAGAARLLAMPRDLAFLIAARPIEIARAAADLGDVPIVRRRVALGAPAGELGCAFEPAAPRTVAQLAPGGPAARAGVIVGDTVVSIDGVDVRAAPVDLLDGLLQVPPGATIVLGLARGATVAIVASTPD